jgi:hypothetical protein
VLIDWWFLSTTSDFPVNIDRQFSSIYNDRQHRNQMSHTSSCIVIKYSHTHPMLRSEYLYNRIRNFPLPWNPNIHHVLTKPHSCTLSSSYLTNFICIKSIRLPTAWSLPLKIFNQDIICISCFPYACYMSRPSILIIFNLIKFVCNYVNLHTF